MGEKTEVRIVLLYINSDIESPQFAITLFTSNCDHLMAYCDHSRQWLLNKRATHWTATSILAYDNILRNPTFGMFARLNQYSQSQDLQIPKVGLQSQGSYAWWVVCTSRAGFAT
jgi:hypothetical protein